MPIFVMSIFELGSVVNTTNTLGGVLTIVIVRTDDVEYKGVETSTIGVFLVWACIKQLTSTAILSVKDVLTQSNATCRSWKDTEKSW